MKIDKFIDYNQPSKLEEILNLMLNQPHIESKSVDYKPIHSKIISEIKGHIGTVGIFGSGITSFYSIFVKLIDNSGFEVTTKNVVMMTICALCVVYMDEENAEVENPAKLKKWIKSCLEECRLNGTYGFFKKMVEVIKSVKELCIFLLKKCGKVVNTLTDMFSYTSFFAPFAIAVAQLISNHSIDIDTLPGIFTSIGIGTFTVTAKHYLSELISKLKIKFKKDPLKDISVTPDNSVDKFSEWKEKDMINEDGILESKGISNASLEYSNIIYDILSKYFHTFIKGQKWDFVRNKYIGENSIIVSDEAFDELPITNMILNIEFHRVEGEEFSRKYPNSIQNFRTTGGCYFIENTAAAGQSYLTKNGFCLKLDLGILLNNGKFSSDDIDLLEMEMESTILHELNHAYEGLKRGNKNKIVTSLTWSLDVNATKVPDEVWSRWYDAKDGIGYNLYWAEDHETNAMIQDSYPYTKRYSVGEMKKHTPSWEYANRMLSFNAKKFKQSMIDVIQNHMKEDPNVVLDKMKNGLADTIDSNMKKWKEKTISISGESIRKMSVDQFLEYCEKKIHKSANRLKRGILRHYSK